MPIPEPFSEAVGGMYWHETHQCYVVKWDEACNDDRRHWHR